MKYCDDYRDHPNCPGCCSSCHEDYEAGYDGLQEVVDPKTDIAIAQTCCAMNDFVRQVEFGEKP